MLKTFTRILINTLLGAVLIYFWLKLVNISEILHVLSEFDLYLLFPVCLFFLIAVLLKALRFKFLLSKEIKISSLKIINLTFLSQLLSFTIPVRAGEITKGVYLASEFKLHFGKAIVWVFLDRFLDFWAVLLLSSIFLIFLPSNLPHNFIMLLFFAVAIFSVVLLFVVLKPNISKSLVKFLSELLMVKKLKHKSSQFGFFILECLSLLKGSTKRNFVIFLLTVSAAFSEGICWYILLGAFIGDISLLKAWLGSMLTALTFIIPAAPGYVGSAEAAGLAVFSYVLGFDKTFVSAATVIFHGISLILILSTGIIGLYFLKFKLSEVWGKLRNK